MDGESAYVRDAPGGLSLHPAGASTMAAHVDMVFYALVLVSLALVLAIGALIFYFSIRYRTGSRAIRESQLTERGALWMEIGWIVPTVVVFVAIFAWAGALYIEQYRLPEDAHPVNVVAKQWMWKIEHSNGAQEINELHVPVGEKILLRMTSQDVIHSFSVPAFRTKRDVLPGRYTSLWFEASEPGVYSLFCTEYCGVDHSRMRGRVVALAPADFERWLARQDVPVDPAERGRELFSAYGCAGCHAQDSDTHAPSLEGLYGKPVQLEDGGTVEADHGYIRDSILLPQKHVVAGYEPVMPSYQGQIDESDILALVAHIQSLGQEGENGP